MKKASIIMAVMACAIIAGAYTNSVPISANTRAATEKWTAIRFEPALPPTPENAASKFLNGNREWQTVAEQDLAALRAYHYGSPDIVESPAGWFVVDGAGTITAFNWDWGRENVVIPWEIGGVPVTAIGANSFTYSALETIISARTITSIGEFAFGNCTELKSVSITSATSVGDYVFNGCRALTSVYFSADAPIEATDVFNGITQPPTVYVTDPQATGWGATWNGAPVVRPPLYGSNVTAQAYTLNGDTITEWPSGATNITDGVTSGTYSETTRTIDISNLLAGVSMELPEGGGATNITDGVTSGTYSEATRTLDISPICSRQSIRAWMPLTTHSQYGFADLVGTAGSTVGLGPAPLNSFVIRVAIPTAYAATDFTVSNIVFFAGSEVTPPKSQGFNCVTTGVFSVSSWGLQSPIGFLMRRNDGIINFGYLRRDVSA